ncbi:helix-turn-helix domain-containing protein [Clostridium tertium]|uniref:Helix-turn-helix domain-containing protein n=1 Tax=Clostridium tertium TaxID=1559 RepID=A0A9X3XN13_9CLOT|nr:helix-turn-helix transcriptional regulator [Clostridium tertium]MDC4241978.1 helix-turn-helix domain-containing protein [Clostridium tertium]
MATFAERLKDERLNKNLTQTQLAEYLYLDRSSISKYETGKQIPETPTLEKLSEFFNISIDYLLGKSDLRNNKDILNKKEPTIALHSDYEYDELPDEAKKEIENFIEYVKAKYKK